MSGLALDNEILLKIDKAERYIGGEWNEVIKDKDRVKVRFCMCFPDVYEIGMSHLGIQILYDLFNRMEDVWCARVYSTWDDLEAIMRERNIPLFALESQDPVRCFDFLGITLQYELCYTNVLQILDLSGIPLRSENRTDDDPIVIGGGPCAYNPEPIADFFDLFYIGEGEVRYGELMDLYKTCKDGAFGPYSRAEFLRRASQIPGIYVPSLYAVSYREDGTIESFTPVSPEVPARVRRQVVLDMDSAPYPEKPVVPNMKVVQDRAVVEVQRGCIRGCRFCQAGMIYRPLRERSLERVEQLVDSILTSTGFDELSLSSLSTSDYSRLPELTDYLLKRCSEQGIRISLPSLRIDAFSLDVMKKVQDIGKASLTFAPEAGSQRMRDVINKGLREEDILGGALQAFRGGWNKVKLYFMLGLPGEQEEDLKAIAQLCEKIAVEYYEIPVSERNGRVSITASSSLFVPKPHTPFQWARMNTKDELIAKAQIVKGEMFTLHNRRSIWYIYYSPEASVMEGILSRGDRRLSAVIEEAYRRGARYDAWTDKYREELWEEAFRTCGIDPGFYVWRERGEDEIFPWDFIDIGVRKDFLLREWRAARAGTITKNCREQCQGCGCTGFGTGICVEPRGN